MAEYKWLNILAKQYGNLTYIFCSCRDINDSYSMGDTYSRFGRARGLIAKQKEITLKCSMSSNPMARCVDLTKFSLISNLECADAEECLYLCRFLTVVFKRFYVNDFGGFAIPNFPIDKILPVFKWILEQLRVRQMTEIEIMGKFDQHFKQFVPSTSGQVYVIDNLETTKVGCSHNAEKRFENLKANRELNQDATLYAVLNVEDMEGFEASAQCLLNQFKDQNPAKSKYRNVKYGALDEHFKCRPDEAMSIIYPPLSAYIINN